MDAVRDKFNTARQEMIYAFAALSGLAGRAGADPDEITAVHSRFFDANVEAKAAFRVAVLLALTDAAGREAGGGDSTVT